MMHTKLALIAALAVGVSASAGFAVADEAEANQVKANFAAADADADKQLNADEFKSFIDLNAEHSLGRAATIRRFGAYGTAFAKADRDGDGFVTTDEIRASQSQ